MMKGGTKHNGARMRPGFTLVELLLALVILALIAVAAAAMLSAVIYATGEDHDTRRAMIRRQVAVTRLGSLVRESAMVLDHGPTHVVLWTDDTDASGSPSLSELRRIDWHVGNQELVVHESDPGSPPIPNPSYVLGDDFDAITTAVAGGTAMPSATALANVVAFQISVDDADVQQARIVEMAITIRQASGDDTAVVSAALRVDAP